MTLDPFNATIAAREDLNDQLSIVRIRPDSGAVPAFTPGQFCTLGLPPDPPGPSEGTPLNLANAPPPLGRAGRVRMVRRAYSVASPADVRHEVELLMVLVPQGRLTPRLWRVPTGGRVFLDPKIDGRFTLDGVPADKDVVAVATGTGLSPYVSMLRTYRNAGQPPRWRRFVLIHGVRAASDLAYRDELERIAREDPSVRYIPTVTREPEGGVWSGCRGRVQCVLEPDVYSRLAGGTIDPNECHVFLCGNPAMIDDAEKMLNARGFVTETLTTPGNLHFERYW